MESVTNLIKQANLISAGDIVGVAVSGGSDSMALLHKLNALSNDMDFEVVAIHVDHQIRQESGDDARFVLDYCKENHIRAYKFKVDIPHMAKEKNQSIETVARDARIAVFESLIQKGIVDKIAIAHHMSDQAETILLHLFRGSGLAGARGMEISKKGATFIRPMLETRKEDISAYIIENEIPYVQDATNEDSNYSRNYIRNEIMPIILKKWPNAINSLNNFAKTCQEDDDFINSQVFLNACVVEDKTVKIPNSYFLYKNAIVTRLVFKALHEIGITHDIEKKHIEMIKDLALKGANGSKISLPNDITVHKEYDFTSIVNKYVEPKHLSLAFRLGTFEIDGVGRLIVKRAKNQENKNLLYVDSKKIPEESIWRFRDNGDIFQKFGGGTKKLKSYLIDQKIPQRLRDTLPVLALEDEVYVIAGVEISEQVKIDEETKHIWSIEFIKSAEIPKKGKRGRKPKMYF